MPRFEAENLKANMALAMGAWTPDGLRVMHAASEPRGPGVRAITGDDVLRTTLRVMPRD